MSYRSRGLPKGSDRKIGIIALGVLSPPTKRRQISAFSLFSVILLVALVPTTAFCDEGFYISGKTGLVLLGDFKDVTLQNVNEMDLTTIEFDTGMGLLGAVGYDFGLVRLEGELGYTNNDLEKFCFEDISVAAGGDVTELSLLMNIFLDIPTPTNFSPYVGGGIGVSYTSVNKASINEIELLDDGAAVFAYQLSAGIGYELTDSLVLEMGYRYLATADPSFTDIRGLGVDVENASHNITLGLRIMF